MEYKLLKETPWVAKDAIIEFDRDSDSDTTISNDKFKVYLNGKDYSSETYDWITWLICNHPEDFEEVKETPKPRWKVGDYVVKEYSNLTPEYIKIAQVGLGNSKDYLYNGDYEEKLRDPTPEELSTYFR